MKFRNTFRTIIPPLKLYCHKDLAHPSNAFLERANFYFIFQDKIRAVSQVLSEKQCLINNAKSQSYNSFVYFGFILYLLRFKVFQERSRKTNLITQHSRLRRFLIRYHQQYLTRVDQHAPRIPKMYCMKSQKIVPGRAVLASTAKSARFW